MNWLTAVDYFTTPEFENILLKVDDVQFRSALLPERPNIFRAFSLVPFYDVKVVILGQDPYPTRGHAMGLAFSVPKKTDPLPKSLQNIFMELEDDVDVLRENGDLTDWAKQGVFLLNTALTVQEGKPGSHTELWRGFTDAVIKALSEKRSNLVFVLWGKHAQSKARLIDDEKHDVIVSAHPSPLAASRGFFGSRPFSRINNHLNSKNIAPISW